MTETDWLACTDPDAILAHVEGRLTRRQLRLFACACWRRMWHLLPEGPIRRAVELRERDADDLVGEPEWEQAMAAARDAIDDARRSRRLGARVHDALVGIDQQWDPAASFAARRVAQWAGGWAVAAECKAHCDLLREIFGNPFRPPTADPAWLRWNDATVAKLARAIYAGRHFGDLPILADALEEAGCAEGVILTHCRDDRGHVPGCWLVDLLTGKE